MKNRLNTTLTKLMMKQFVEYWYYYLGAFICLFFTHYIQSSLPFLAKELAEIVQTGAESIDTKKFFLLALGIVVFRTSSRLLFFYPARVMQKHLRLELLEKLQNAIPVRYQKFSSGQIFTIIGNDMEQLRALIGFALLQVGNIIIAMAVLVPKLTNFNSQLVMALIPLVVAFVLFTYIVSKNRIYYKLTQDLQGEVQNYIMESYEGKKTIKNYHSEKSFIDLFKAHSYKELLNFYKAGTRVAVAIPLVPFGVGVSLLWGAHIIKTLDLGASSLVLFSGFVFLFLEPLMFLSWIGVVFTRSQGSWTRIKELVDSTGEVAPIEEELLDLNENYDGSEVKIPFWDEKISVHLNEGMWSVLIGRTGHGKTEAIKKVATLLSLKGDSISYVAQSPYLYNDSILGNIFLGREYNDADKDRAYEFLKLFGLDYLESDKEALLNMEVGENGKRLSGGQAKRLCLVRSIMSESRVLLWDDPFSSVDLILEKQIISKLREMDEIKSKAVLLSSHRLSTVRLSDEVIYLDQNVGIVEKVDVLKLVEQSYKGKVLEYFESQMV